MNPIDTATTCWCGTPVCVVVQGGFWHAYCSHCYDPTEDAGTMSRIFGAGQDAEAALWSWSNALDSATDLVLTDKGKAAAEAHRASERVPASEVDIHAELARDVGVEALRQERWSYSVATDVAADPRWYGPAPEQVAC